MDSIQVSVPFSKLLEDTNINNLAIASLMLGADVEKTEENDGLTTYTNIKNNKITYKMLTLDFVGYIISIGGEVKNYHTFIEINPTDLVPSFIRENSTTVDSDENNNELSEPIIKNLTWNEWIHPSQNIITIASKSYISSFAHYGGFKSSEKSEKCLLGSEITALRTAGYNVLTKGDFIDLQNT